MEESEVERREAKLTSSHWNLKIGNRIIQREVYIYIYIGWGERIERMIIRDKLPSSRRNVTQNLLFPELPIHNDSER